jgi:hypothetical protein
LTEAAEQKVGRLSGSERCLGPLLDLGLFGLDQLDLFAGVLLEGGHDLGDRLVGLGKEPLVPPHHEVRRLCAERHENQRGQDKGERRQHWCASVIGSCL